MKAIFLDVDGVLLPYGSYYRFNDLSDSMVEGFNKRYGVNYYQYGIDVLSSVYYDWDEQAVARLKYALEYTDSKIIVSSDWRCMEQKYKMRDLLKIHNLDKYWYADNAVLKKDASYAETRALEIKDSLDRYPIDNFVVLDDMKELGDYFPDNMVLTNNCMSIDDMKKCIKILKK